MTEIVLDFLEHGMVGFEMTVSKLKKEETGGQLQYVARIINVRIQQKSGLPFPL